MGKVRMKTELKTTASKVTRKELRKEKRLLKKKSKSIFYENLKRNPSLNSSKSITPSEKGINYKTHKKVTFAEMPLKQAESENKINADIRKRSAKKIKTSMLPSHDYRDVVTSGFPTPGSPPKITLKEKLQKQMKMQRKRQLLDAVKEDDKEIKIWEKRLKLNKRKNKSTSRGFVECGLDYILDACDPDKIKSDVNTEHYFEDSDSDFAEDVSFVQGRNMGKYNVKSCSKFNQSKECSQEPSELSNPEIQSNDSDTSFSESELSDIDDCMNDETPTNHQENEEKEKKYWEDIYGRLRDSEGSVVKVNQGKYLPPHLRMSENFEIEKLKKQLKGLLNRLAQSNMHSIANEIETLYSKHSRHSVNETIIELFLNNLVTNILSPERLIIDHAILIAILHANIGSEVGAYMLQRFVEKFHSMLSQNNIVENKELDNILYLISYMYNFKIFESCLMFDILNKLTDSCSEKNIDLILVVLKSVGFCLRKDDPNAMKQFLLSVQRKCNELSAEDNSRMKYMLSVLINIKNNNISKLSEFSSSQHEQNKSVLKLLIRQGNSVVPLRIGLDDLLKVEELGRWWLVGSAWKKEDNINKVVKQSTTEKYSSELLELAKKQRMNTDNRRNIFCILMSAIDYQEAFEKILKLGLKGQQEREVPLVIIHCLLQEKHFNPYYGLILDQLCMSNRRHQMTLQCALWDRFKDLQSLIPSKIHILAQFLAQLFIAGSLPISVLKVVEFAELDKHHIRLLRQTILSVANEENIKNVFIKVSKSKKLLLFREALKLFLHHFILRNMEEGDLKEKINRISNMLVESEY